MIWWLTNKSRFSDAPQNFHLAERTHEGVSTSNGNFKSKLLHRVAGEQLKNLISLEKQIKLPNSLNDIVVKTSQISDWTPKIAFQRLSKIEKIRSLFVRVIQNYRAIAIKLNNSFKNKQQFPELPTFKEKQGLSEQERAEIREREEKKAAANAARAAARGGKGNAEALAKYRANETPEKRLERIESTYAKNYEKHQGQGSPFEKKPAPEKKKELPPPSVRVRRK